MYIGTFYDDHYSKAMQTGHYTGVFMAFLCLVGLWLQQCYDIEPTPTTYVWLGLLTVWFLVFFLLFFFYDTCFPLKDASRNEITKRSRLVIGFETASLGTLTLSFSLYFILYPNELSLWV